MSPTVVVSPRKRALQNKPAGHDDDENFEYRVEKNPNSIGQTQMSPGEVITQKKSVYLKI